MSPWHLSSGSGALLCTDESSSVQMQAHFAQPYHVNMHTAAATVKLHQEAMNRENFYSWPFAVHCLSA